MTIRPDFYDAFRCLAGGCAHSCCRGWEIDVDEASEEYYVNLHGAIGAKLRAALYRDGEGAHFRLDAERRCPFLQPDGLCELICELGEDALCDICALHPRFFEELDGHLLCGLGLSCEAVCALLLADEGPLRFAVQESGERLTLGELLRRLGREIPDARLRFDGAPPTPAFLDRLAATEAIDESWPAELAALRAALPGRERGLPTGPRADRVLQYLLFRQLERLDDCGTEALLDFARNSAAFVLAQDLCFGSRDEHLRRWSEQIEYSTENADILLGKRND